MLYKLAIFDFDGTLADSFSWVVRTANKIATRYGAMQVREDEVDLLRRKGARQLLKERHVPFWKIFPMANYARKCMNQDIDQIRAFDGIGNMLQTLSQRGVPLGLVTSNIEPNVQRVLDARVALFKYCEYNVSLFGKPRRLKKVLRHSGLASDEVIYIGDEIRDLEAARKVKIPFGAVSWGYTHPEALLAYAPDEIFATPAEIISKITDPENDQ